jgi:hypothetical protein
MRKSKSKTALSFKESKEKVYKLKHLPPLSPFTFLSGDLSFKNMKLVYASDSRCVVKGFRNMGAGESGEIEWREFEDNCAPDAEVFFDRARSDLWETENAGKTKNIKKKKEN